MIIVNADDWGRSQAETDAALSCYRKASISSVTAMVFMEDSRRAADIAKSEGMEVGLHLNLTQPFTDGRVTGLLHNYHNQIVHFLTMNKYAFLLYHPALRQQFHYVYHSQVEEFVRLYGTVPSHIDGHHHKHLCTNMIIDKVIPSGQRVRRNFSFSRDDKVVINRMYRRAVDMWLAGRYRLADYFFSLSHCLQTNKMTRVAELSKAANVEVMAHPVKHTEYAYLTGADYAVVLREVKKGTYSCL